MDLQKVRKALDVALREHNDLMLQADLPTGSKIIEEALAEIEKPAEEGALSTVIKWAEGYFDHDIIIGAIHESLAVLLNQYAESYHAKKCAECSSGYWSKPPKSYPLPEAPRA